MWVLALGIAIQVYVLANARPGMYTLRGSRTDLFHAGVLLEGAFVVAGVLGVRALARVWFPAVLVISLALGSWMLAASRHPRMDVIEVHETALQALVEGRNPYSITFRNIYADSAHYNPKAVAGDVVLFGYPYPPLNLLLALPGHLLLRDYRYAELAALIAAAALIGWMGSSCAQAGGRAAADDAEDLLRARTRLDRAGGPADAGARDLLHGAPVSPRAMVRGVADGHETVSWARDSTALALRTRKPADPRRSSPAQL